MDEWVRNADIRFARNLKDAEGAELNGQTIWHPEERRCWIAIAHGTESDELHETLVHELLHILLEGHLALTHPYDAGYEFGLNRAAKAIWTAWKGE